MYYWNQANFRGLKDIGEGYKDKGGYTTFADYCIFKEKGLKKQAIKAIETFIIETKSMEKNEQRGIAKELISLSYYNKDIHQLIPHPLHQFLITVLRDWAEDEPNNVTPYRWLGYMCRDISSYEKALKLNVTDEVSIIELANASLNSIDYQTHHLSETKFLGELEDARSSLQKVYELTENLRHGQIKDNILEEYKYFKRLIDTWEEYKKEQSEFSFPQWCKSKGEAFNFWNIVYYKK